jgi:hypothetical protein
MTTDDSNVSEDELESTSGEPLPDREAMSILPIDPAGGPTPLPLPVEPVAEPQDGGATMHVEPPAES